MSYFLLSDFLLTSSELVQNIITYAVNLALGSQSILPGDVVLYEARVKIPVGALGPIALVVGGVAVVGGAISWIASRTGKNDGPPERGQSGGIPDDDYSYHSHAPSSPPASAAPANKPIAQRAAPPAAAAKTFAPKNEVPKTNLPPRPAPAPSAASAIAATQFPTPQHTNNLLRQSFARSAQDVDVSIFAPPAVRPSQVVDIQVIFHAPEKEAAALEHARNQRPTAELLASSALLIQLSKRDKVRVTLETDDAGVDNPVRSLIWTAEMSSLTFLLKTPPSPTSKKIKAKVRIFVNETLAGSLVFSLSYSDHQASNPPRRLQANNIRFQKPFFSYASQDRDKVLEIAQAYKLAGIDCFVDILSLSPGERWQKGLYRNIDQCDAFLLFWSQNARNSKWVIKEAEYALARQKNSTGQQTLEICPVILEGPPAITPPTGLSDIHFDDPIRHIISAKKAVQPVAPGSSSPSLRLVSTDGRYDISLCPGDVANGAQKILGRASHCPHVLEGESVSSEHAALSFLNGAEPAICDLGSTNGTYVDGQAIGQTPVSLSRAKKVEIGGIVLNVRSISQPPSPGKIEQAPRKNATTIFLNLPARKQSYQILCAKLAAGKPLTIGRNQSCRIVIDDVSVSNQHAELWLDPQLGLVLRDLNSSNGTVIDDRRIGPDFTPLSGTNIIRLGAVEIRLTSK